MAHHTPLLFDLGPLSCGCTDHALESLHKALGDPPDDSIWAPHHDPLVSGHIEAVTAHGLAVLDAILAAMIDLLGLELRKAAWARWSESDLEDARAYLDLKDPRDYTPGDWFRLIDWLLNRYLPPGVVETEAEYLVARANLAGRLQANLDAKATAIEKATLAAVLPGTIEGAHAIARFTPRQAATLDFAKTRAAELIADIGDATRHRLRKIIIDHEEGRALGSKDSTLWSLQSRMQDEFAILNRDWRRVAITEVARDANEGFLSSLEPGTKVNRVEAYPTACPWCKKIHGRVLTVVDPAAEDKDGETQVWVGKTNVGRSASPRKRVGDDLVERMPEERYWIAAGVQHPHCRGTWQILPKEVPGADPKFKKWLDEQIAESNRQQALLNEQAADKLRAKS